jgi:hypothetical protein
MFFSALLSLRMFITNETKSDFVNVSQHFPVFALFYSHYCGHCVKLYPTWDNFTHLYESDPKIIVAECDCANYSAICTELGPVHGYPSFFLYFGGRRDHIHIDRTVESFSAQVEDLKAADPKSPCQRHWNQTGNYPYIGFSFAEDDTTACSKLQSIATDVINSTTHLLLAKSNPDPQIEVMLSDQYRFTRPGLPNHTAIVAFVKDFIHQIYGGWPLSESHEVIFRRFAFVIFHEEWKIFRIESVFLALSDVLCTGKLNVSVFREQYPEIGIEDGDCPALAITNEDQSKFMLLKGVASPDGLEERVGGILNISKHPEMIHSYKCHRTVAPVAEAVEQQRPEVALEPPSRWASVLLFAVVLVMLVGCALSQRRVRRIAVGVKIACLRLLAQPTKDPEALL